jgi:hypothetical protein
MHLKITAGASIYRLFLKTPNFKIETVLNLVAKLIVKYKSSWVTLLTQIPVFYSVQRYVIHKGHATRNEVSRLYHKAAYLLHIYSSPYISKLYLEQPLEPFHDFRTFMWPINSHPVTKWNVTGTEDSSLLGCLAVLAGKQLPTLRRSVGPLSSGSSVTWIRTETRDELLWPQ